MYQHCLSAYWHGYIPTSFLIFVFISSGCFIAASAYDDRFAVFSVSESAGSNIIDKMILYPSENDGEASFSLGPSRINVRVTIWSMSFISKESKKVTEDEHSCILAMVAHRQGASFNDLLLFSCNSRENTIRTISQYSEPGSLAISITEVPHLSGFAFVSRVGDILLMDLRDPSNPCCIQKISVSTGIVEDNSFADESCRGIDVDDEGMSKVAACALLELRDSGDDMVRRDDPMSIDRRNNGTNSTTKYVSSWSWEPSESNPKLIMCLSTGELFVLEVNSAVGGMRVNMCNSLYKVSSCNVLLWLESGLIAAFVEMGDGMIFKFEHGELLLKSRIQNLSPILDLCFVDYHGEKQDQMFACCGMRPEGSLRIVRSGISVDRLYRSLPIYKGITGTWTLRMKESDSHHSFLVVSFVEQTRVLSVGLSFIDASDVIGFQTDVCTLACGLLADGLLVQIHRTEVRLCLPTITAHPEGIPLPQPISASWYPSNMTISVGAVGHNFIVIATSYPCYLFILGFRSLSVYQYEIYEIQHVRLHYEVSCISIPHKKFRQRFSGSTIGLADKNHKISVPSGIEIGSTFVVGTHKPSVELLSFSPDEGCKVLAVGRILLNNTFGTPISGCIPEDVKIVLVDRFYVLAGLRNGMLLRFEWPTYSSVFQSGTPEQSSFTSLSKQEISLANATSSCIFGPQYCSMSMMGEVNNSVPLLQLIAFRRIGITPVFLVPLHESLDADIIALSDRPWLLQTARHNLAYTSISFQCATATHVTPVSTVHCPKGVLFVAENSLHLVCTVQCHNSLLGFLRGIFRMAESGRVVGSAPADPDPESGRSQAESGSGLCKPSPVGGWVFHPPRSRVGMGRFRSESADSERSWPTRSG
ncbi:hypothetical protein Taro_008339, partial [Colocasia esculenta]|nr:hypothetical protein [Colocasia esculenta]